MINIDIVIIGCGIQGLVLLDFFRKNNINAIIITKDNSSFQSIVNHGYMHSGCIFPSKDALKRKLFNDWSDDIIESIKYKNQDCFFIGNNSFLKQFLLLWNEYNINYNKLISSPSQFKKGLLEHMEYYNIPDYSFNKEKLLNIYGEKYSSFIYYGNITSIISENNKNIIKFEHDTGLLSIICNKVYLCAGTGNYNICTKIQDICIENIKQKANNLHILCIKGNKDILPLQSIICWPQQIMISAHPYGDNECIYYISLFNKLQNQLNSLGNEKPLINKTLIQNIIDKIFDIMPQIESNKHLLEWNYYSEWKNDNPNINAHFIPYIQAIESFPNIIIVNPNIIANVFNCAKEAFKLYDHSNKGENNIHKLPITKYKPINIEYNWLSYNKLKSNM